MSLTDLAAFRAETPGSPAAKKAKAVWTEPTMVDFATEDRYVIGVDQTLGALGLVHLTLHRGELEVHRSITLKGVAASWATGWEKELQEFEHLRLQLLDELPECHQDPLGWVLYHEAPPVGSGNVKLQVHSSLLGGAALRAAAQARGLPWGPMIRPQDWKRILIDVPNAEKPTIKKLLLPFTERLGVRGMDLVTNESQRDALGVGLASMIRSAR